MCVHLDRDYIDIWDGDGMWMSIGMWMGCGEDVVHETRKRELMTNYARCRTSPEAALQLIESPELSV